jgi:hypothetical protein
MNPISLMLLLVVVSGLLAAPIAHALDPDGAYFYNLRRLDGQQYIWISWWCTAYAFAVMAFLYRFLRFKPVMDWQAARPAQPLTQRTYLGLWWLTWGLALVCLGIVVFQVGGKMPIFEVQRAGSAVDVALRRAEIAQLIDRRVLNVGLIILMPLNVLIAFSFLRSRVYGVLSVLLYVALGVFPLEKGPLAVSIVSFLFFRLLWKPVTRRQTWHLAGYAALFLTVVIGMSYATKYVETPQQVGEKLFGRLVYGTISDLPYYFEVFETERHRATTNLPPSGRRFVAGMAEPPASRRVLEKSQPGRVRAGYAGVANSFYVGEAYAVGGYPLVLLSPFLVMVNLLFVTRLFRSVQKNLLTTYGQSLILFVFFVYQFAGIGGFVFSLPQVLLIGYFLIRFLARLRPPRGDYEKSDYFDTSKTPAGLPFTPQPAGVLESAR